MRLDPAGTCHLTYCTNIHAGESWAEVRENLGRYLTAVRQRLAPAADFGVGLRLSAAAAVALSVSSASSSSRSSWGASS